MNLPFTYAECLEEMVRADPRSYLLSDFWRLPNRWPKGEQETIFIGDAIQLIGKLKFGEAWTGDELSAERRASSRPSFSGTLEYYWEQVRRTFPANTFTVTSLASWNGTVPPPFATLSSISPREANAQRSARAKKLVQEGPSFALRMTSTSQTGRNAKMIMTAQSNDCGGYWTGLLAGRLGDLKTHLRRVDSEIKSGHYIEAPEGFWNVENPIQSRFRKGHTRTSLNGEEPKNFYIHFSEASLKISSIEISNPNPAVNDVHLSLFMRLILQSLKDLNVSPENQPDTAIFVDYF
jgi:hypothetical protein